MKKTIKKVSPVQFGHLMLEFEDGTKQLVHRGDHEPHGPKAGDAWPPDGHEHVTTGIYTGQLVRKAVPAAPALPEAAPEPKVPLAPPADPPVQDPGPTGDERN